MPLRVGIIGAGGIAAEHARSFASVEGAELAGVFSRTRSTAEKFAADNGIPIVTDSVDELYSQAQPDLVVLAVSVNALHPVALQCLRKPWALFVEKPPGLRPDQTAHLVSEADAGSRRVFTAFNRRHLPSTNHLAGQLSESSAHRFVRVLDQEDQVQARAMGHPEEVVSNWMYANAIHIVDLLRLYGRGAITQVEPVVPFGHESGTVVARITYSSGDVGLYEAVWNRPGPWAAEVTTESARYEQRPLESLGIQPAGSRATTPVNLPPQKDFKPGFREQAQAVVTSLSTDSVLATPLEDALHSMRLVEAIYHPDDSDFTEIPPPAILA